MIKYPLKAKRLIEDQIILRSQYSTTLVNGIVVRRLRFGEAPWEQIPPTDENCDMCPATRGQFHMSGCKSEVCPHCSDLLQRCECEAPLETDPKSLKRKFRIDPKTLHEQLVARSQYSNTFVNGEVVKRIRSTASVCKECGVPSGQYHIQGCNQENCPACDDYFLGCDCEAPIDSRARNMPHCPNH